MFWRREKYFAPVVTRAPDRRSWPGRHTDSAEGVLAIMYKEACIMLKAKTHRHAGIVIQGDKHSHSVFLRIIVDSKPPVLPRISYQTASNDSSFRMHHLPVYSAPSGE